MYINKIIIGSILFIVLLGAFLFFTNEEKNFVDILKKYRITFSNASDFEMTKNSGQNITAVSGGEVIKLKILKDIEVNSAEKYIGEQKTLFESIFKPQLPPYPEFLTKETGCDEMFLPVENSGENGEYYTVFAGQRFGFGICADDLIKYKASIKFLYCTNTRILAKLEYFVPNSMEFNDLIEVTESFNCL